MCKYCGKIVSDCRPTEETLCHPCFKKLEARSRAAYSSMTQAEGLKNRRIIDAGEN